MEGRRNITDKIHNQSSGDRKFLLMSKRKVTSIYSNSNFVFGHLGYCNAGSGLNRGYGEEAVLFVCTPASLLGGVLDFVLTETSCFSGFQVAPLNTADSGVCLEAKHCPSGLPLGTEVGIKKDSLRGMAPSGRSGVRL